MGSGGSETVLGAVTISGNVTLVSQGSNTLTFTGPIELGSNPLTVTGLGEVVLAGQVSVDDGLTKLGCGTLVLAGDNAYTGGTTVDGGVLDVAAPSALPGYDTSGAVSVSSGGGLAVYVGGTNDWSLADLAILWSHATFVSGAAVGLDTIDGDFTYAGSIPGGLGLVKLGANTLTLTAADACSGTTTIDGGVLQLDDLDALQNATVVVEREQRLGLRGGRHL